MTEIKIPAVGESITEATIAEWSKSNGETVERDEVILTLETDKASVEVVAEVGGVLNIKAEAGATVGIGEVVGQIEENLSATAKPHPKPTTPPIPKQSNTSTGGAPMDVKIPAVGESITEATIAEWSVADGDFVEQNDVLLSLETDKASVEVVAENSGIVSIAVPAGETVSIGTKVATITPGQAPAANGSAGAPKTPGAAANTMASTQGTTNSSLSPAVSRIVGENNLNPSQITGTGKHGQITKADAMNALNTPQPQAPLAPAPSQSSAPAAKAPELPNADFTGFTPTETRTPMSRLRQTIARRLVDAQHTAAILTTFNEIDMGPVMELRKKYKDSFQKKHDVKLGFMGFFVKAAVEALKEFPLVNGSIEGTDIISRNYVNMGIAVGTPKGLMVPVIRNADKISLADIEKSIMHYADKARNNKISMDDLAGGTFTISNGGTYGSMMSTPILNPPQSGILGLHKIEERPMAINGEVVIRPMMYVALSYDHRIIDGSESVRFLVKIKECMEDPARMLLEV